MISVYVFFFLFQLLNTYIGVLAPFNPYVFAILFIIYGFKGNIKFVNLKILTILLIVTVSLIIIYTVKFSFIKSFLISAKAIQFNFGYLFLIPGFTVFFNVFRSIKLKNVLSCTFWVMSLELMLEFILLRILKFSPVLFTHYPKIAHIRYDPITKEYAADRLLGMASNASVTGVLYTCCFAFYFGYLYYTSENLFAKKNLLVLLTFIVCFFLVVSGSAFFAILLSLFLIWSQRKGNLLKNLLIAILVIPAVLLGFNFLSGFTEAFGNKFTVGYLLLLFQNDELEGSLPYVINEMAQGYSWFKFFFGSYFFEWGNPDAVIKTVDYFYVNLVYEFGLIGLCLFIYIIKLTFDAVKRLDLIEYSYLKFGFFVLVFGSLHYPAVVYMASQVFLSAIAAIGLRNRKVPKEPDIEDNLLLPYPLGSHEK